ncbi:MAG TPA: NADH-ubiquinone oxidoreductase-F iron-sulfur binding region domain-containing protein [Methanospirillum sp.]|uniref:NADH-ubiquinone oxidoreductase-F iron-sulfur binding region domain-containing protein n=1 Tax=Methanospirillum sp. TaxID=45200 RepID=UPI002CB66178|nr:NADH-ubiquinone oxidoreductase-F iron-sulfur binding region domain-containing protein [Methanospirillum sp.]HWQ63861.1 NADH-ubiquinone oxidoreductase-F iron-sulfur binding region domain-containing protein [Methanospirillum sp.]
MTGSVGSIRTPEDLAKIREIGVSKLQPDHPRIAVGLSTCGIAVGGERLFARLQEIISSKGYDIALVRVGCIGFCKEEPIVNITIPGKPLVILHRVSEDDAEAIVNAVLKGSVHEEKALCKVSSWDHITGTITYGTGFEQIPDYHDVPYFGRQTKVILRDAGFINPEDIDEYIAVGGYQAFVSAVSSRTPEEVIDIVKQSDLRGRGGAGFPAGLKWEITREAKGHLKYIVCNADEGDPGAYMNRNEMESDPHMLIEGLLIGAYAIGTSDALIYIRAEYPLAIERLKKAIDQAREYGLVGENILGTGFSCDIQLATGAGAFVCGESTALAASIEGKTGRPRPRPPRLTDKGVWGRPTDLNNVETFCNVPVILARGAEWYRGIGAKGNTGTKVFSLVGKVENVGMVEVPLGTTLHTIVSEIGNGGAGGKAVKAVQTGGPSGGCIPARLFDTPVDFEHLNEAGSMMGSGGIVVMDEDTNMVDIARYFINFATSESCGKCVPCREGLKHTLLILNKIMAGKGTAADLEMLESLSDTISMTSLCGLGQTAPNPVLTTLKYFREEYEALISEGT